MGKKGIAASAAHSKIGASSMYRWSACPGSVKLCEGIPSQQSAYAAEGTQAHEVAELILRREVEGKKITSKQMDFILSCSGEMREAVDVYTDYIINLAKKTEEIHIEHKFDLSELHPGLFGTADCVIYNSKKKHLMVIDYKHGAGISVSPEHNSQLMYYGLGAMLTLKYPCATVELVVVQPRCPHPGGMIRSWTIPSLDLVEFSADLVAFAKETENPNASFSAGDHCRFCPAAAICPELGKQANEIASIQFTALADYDPKKLAEALAKVEQVEGYCKSIREFAYAEAMSGRIPPGYKLVQKRGSRQWADDEEEIISTLRDFGLMEDAIFHPPSLKTPPQVEKAIKGKQMRDEILGPIVKTVSSGMTLVSDDDPRPSVVSTASDDFKALEVDD